MVVVEISLTIVLLVGAGLMMRSFLKLYRPDLGIRTDYLLTMRLHLRRQIPDAGITASILRSSRTAAGRRARSRIGRPRHERAAARERPPRPGDRWSPDRVRNAASGRDDCHDQSDVLRGFGRPASSGSKLCRDRWCSRLRDRHHQSALRVRVLPGRRSNRPPDTVSAAGAEARRAGAGRQPSGGGLANDRRYQPVHQAQLATGGRTAVGRLRSSPAGAVQLHVSHHPQPSRAGRDHERRAPRGAGDRSGSTSGHRADAGAVARAAAVAVPCVRNRVRDPRGASRWCSPRSVSTR